MDTLSRIGVAAGGCGMRATPMSLDQELSPPVIRDELQTVVSMLCSRFPDRSRSEVERLVAEAHQDLADDARIRTHLIPLTLNRCRRLLASVTTTRGH